MLKEYEAYLSKDGKSENTVKSYLAHVGQFMRWYSETFGAEMTVLTHINILDFRSYLQNLKKQKASSINAKLSSMIAFNEFLVSTGQQTDVVITKKDLLKNQAAYASPSELSEKDVDAFRQKVLLESGARDYAIVTLLAYSGLRISEALSLLLSDVDLVGQELKVNNGKGNKSRLVFIGDKVVHALKEYLSERRDNESQFLFVSQRSEKLDRSAINKVCNRYSDTITPHKLRHFYCTIALEKGYSYHEVANQAGHSNINTTLRYTNPTKQSMKDKANKL